MSAVIKLVPPVYVSPPVYVVPPALRFSGTEDAWLWWSTAEIARSNGDYIEGPCHPDQILAAAEVAGFSRFEWHIMMKSGILGAPPDAPIELLVYHCALRKLESVLRARDLIT